jgi:RNA polymerase sigma-70 factor (ECF subfamily)
MGESTEVVEEGLKSSTDPDAFELQALIGRIVLGEEAALAALHSRLATALYRVARRLVTSNECAQEVVADVFVYVWQNAAAFDPARGTVRAWLHVAARHRAIDRRRTYNRHRLLNESYLEAQAAEAPMFLEPSVRPFQDEASVHLALSALSPLRRRLLSMAFFDGLTHEEISVRSGLPLGTVKSHLRRSLLKMRQFLAGVEFEDPRRLCPSSSMDVPVGHC